MGGAIGRGCWWWWPIALLLVLAYTTNTIHAESLLGIGGGSVYNNETDVPCPFGTFKCSEGKCIPQTSVCNYQKDCDKGEGTSSTTVHHQSVNRAK
uniref:Putative low-density lipoprotein receptor ldl n=1 Tax=Anopheles darlingi TaxID=43151 RepID=A0A2M4DPA7_ANODA